MYSPVVKDPPHFIDLVLNMNSVAVSVRRGYSTRRVFSVTRTQSACPTDPNCMIIPGRPAPETHYFAALRIGRAIRTG